MRQARVVVIGAGIGGLTAAALLAKAGFRVDVVEANPYPGGSAATFLHKGYRFDAGATVGAGFHAGGPLQRLGDMLDMRREASELERAWTLHLPDREICLSRDGGDVQRAFPETEAFWHEQERIADITWTLAAAGLPFPPVDLTEAVQLARLGLSQFRRAARTAPFAFRSVADWLRRHGLADDVRFRRFIDSQLLISAQATSAQVNALYGATALDLPRQGVFQLRGGIGALSEQLVKRVTSLGGAVHFRHQARRVIVKQGRARGVEAARGKRASRSFDIPADFVIVNSTPWSLQRLLGEHSPARLNREIQRRRSTQGAFVLHLGLRADKLPEGMASHHHIISDYAGRLDEARSVFLSISPEWDETRAPAGFRAATASTHTRVEPWWSLEGDAYAERKSEYAETMLRRIESAIPGFRSAVDLALPGSPVTYQYYTSRHKGMVGGFPQASIFAARGPGTGIRNLLLVGDSVFPGQSTAAVALGAMRVARLAERRLRSIPR